MDVAIIGAGPTGLFLAGALARRGHRVTAVDRDAGPADDTTWARRGVMQFHHAHAFRFQVTDALRAELPDAYAAWLAAGAEPITVTLPDGRVVPGGMRSRRETFERALRTAVATIPGVTLRRGHVDAVTLDGRRATGLVVDGAAQPADLVVDASGRSGRATRALRAPAAVTERTGIAYVDRVYRLRPGADPGPMTNQIAWQADLDGYQVILFRHERGLFSVLLVRPTDAPELLALRHDAAFDAACRAIPGLDVWTDPDRAEPVTPVLAGGALVNEYRGQAAPDGGFHRDLLFAGDAVCTTTPIFGRGITTSLLGARELLRLLDAGERDLGAAFDAWSGEHLRPWVEDHVEMDVAMRERWAGRGPDLTRRLPSEAILAAAAVDPVIGRAIGPYLGMTDGPRSLDAVEPRARAVYRDGWRPAYAPGPSRAELAEVVRGSLEGVSGARM